MPPVWSKKIRLIAGELKIHFPFTLIGVAAGMGFLALVYFALIRLGHWNQFSTFRNLYHVFHFGHIFFSAITTTAVFYRHEKNALKTLIVGFAGTLIPCGLSDFFLPYLGGLFLGAPMTLHICLIEEPAGVFFFNTLGIAAGIFSVRRFGKISYFSHGSHVFISSFASLFYLVTFGMQNWMQWIMALFIVSSLAVIIPCCSSDIIIPLSFISGVHGHEHEDEHTRHES